MKSEQDEIQNIIDELKGDAIPKTAKTAGVAGIPLKDLNDDNVSEYVYQRTANVIEMGLQTIQNLQSYFGSGADAKELSAFASIINATTKAIDTMNTINLQNKNAKSALELKKLDIAGRKEMVASLPAPQNNTILIGTREEMLAQLKDKKKNVIEMEGDDEAGVL